MAPATALVNFVTNTVTFINVTIAKVMENFSAEPVKVMENSNAILVKEAEHLLAAIAEDRKHLLVVIVEAMEVKHAATAVVQADKVVAIAAAADIILAINAVAREQFKRKFNALNVMAVDKLKSFNNESNGNKLFSERV